MLLSAGLCLVLGFLPASGERVQEKWRERADLDTVPFDPAFAQRMAAEAHDPQGREGSGIGATTVGAGSSSGYEGRLFRSGYTGMEPTFGITSNGWIFYVAVESTDTNYSLVLRSKDGGRTWGQVRGQRQTQDPYLWVDSATDRVFTVDYVVGCGLIAYSDDFGDTWVDLPPVGCGNTDHQTIFAGRPVTSQVQGYPNVIYYCAVGGGTSNDSSTQTACSKSLDGGKSFLPTKSAPFTPQFVDDGFGGLPFFCGSLSGHIFVDPAGTLYVPRGVCGQPWLAISRNEGDTWTRVQVADNGMGRMANGDWDHEAAVRADGAGNVFYSWVARDRIPYLSISKDGGLHWSSPLRVAPPEVNESVNPNMDLDESGRLSIAFMGSTSSPGAPFPNDSTCLTKDNPINDQVCSVQDQIEESYRNTTWNGYIALIEKPLMTERKIEVAPVNDPADPLIVGTCGPLRCQAAYDFVDVEFGPHGELLAAFTDACLPGAPCGAIGEAVLGMLVRPGNPLPDDACSLPGHRVNADPTGDAKVPGDGYDLISLDVAEPAAMPGKLVFTIRVKSLASLPPDAMYYVDFITPSGDQYFAAMLNDQDGVRFVYGFGAIPYQELGPLDAASHYDAAGSITVIVDRSAFGLKPGDLLTRVYAAVKTAPLNGPNLDTTQLDRTYVLAVAGQCASVPGSKSRGMGEPPVFAGPMAPQALLVLIGALIARRRIILGYAAFSRSLIIAAKNRVASPPVTAR